MPEIFISYARTTHALARTVAERLRSLGYQVWLDENLPAHRSYAEVIEERLRAARAVVVIWSAEAVNSEWVQSEADLARQNHKLVQVSIDGTRLPMPFDRIQCADLSGWTGNDGAAGWRKLVASIDDLCHWDHDNPRPTRTSSSPIAHATGPLLAVLAFDNLSGDPEMAYFSDGLSEEILQTVARGSGLKVIGRGSSFQFRGPDKSAAHVAASLNVTHVLDGAVRRSGSKVRVSANLIECSRQTTIWSDRFDRELSDVFVMQDEIAGAVAAALKVAVAPAVPAEPVDPAAYNLYLRALEIRNRGLDANSRRSVVQLLEEATALAPEFARAWVFLATMVAARLRFDRPPEPRAALREQVRTAAQTALSLDSSLGGAHQALGDLEPIVNFAEREGLQLEALAAARHDPTVLTSASLFFAEVGRMGEALRYAREAYHLDPMYPWAANWYANALDYAGRFDEARVLYDSLVVKWPDNELVAWNAIASAAAHGDWSRFDALVCAQGDRVKERRGLREAVVYGERLRNPQAEAPRVLARARAALARTGALPLNALTMMYRLGLCDEVFGLVDTASFAYVSDAELPSPDGNASNGILFSAVYNQSMMRDVRFVSLCARLGLCDYWVESGNWPDCVDEAPYDFRAEAKRLARVGLSSPGFLAARTGFFGAQREAAKAKAIIATPESRS